MMCAVDWLAVVSTALGATVALGGTFLAHRLRSHDERGRDNEADRRQSYADFVLALGDAHARLRQVADRAVDPAALRRETTQAFTESRAYEARERLLMTANPKVAGAGEQAFRQVIQLRDSVRDGARLGSAKFHDAYHDLSAATWALRLAVRRDLGAPHITLADIGKPSWDSRETCDVCQRAAAGRPASMASQSASAAGPSTSGAGPTSEDASTDEVAAIKEVAATSEVTATSGRLTLAAEHQAT
jgi:hypothetical protein